MSDQLPAESACRSLSNAARTCLWLLAACAGGSAEAPRGATADSLHVLSPPVPLGTDSATSVSAVNYVAVGGSLAAVVDLPARRIVVFDLSGQKLWSLDHRTGPPHPSGVAWLKDQLLIVDVDPDEGVWVFDRDGRLVRKLSMRLKGSPTGVGAFEGLTLVSVTESDQAILADTSVTAYAVDSITTPLSACRPNALYRASIARSGIAQIFRWNGVTVSPKGFYCWEPLSPLIRLLDRQLRLVDSVDLSEHMTPVRDANFSLDLRSINRFRTTVDGIEGVFATNTQLHVLLARHDTTLGRDRFRVVRCALVAANSCRSWLTPYKVVGATSDDTLVAVGSRTAGDSVARLVTMVYPDRP